MPLMVTRSHRRWLMAFVIAVTSGCKVKVSANASAHADESGVSADAAGAVDSDTVRVTVRRAGDELVHDDGEINFETDSAKLVGERTQATLEAYAEVLDEYPDVALRIEGHTDSRASDRHNRQLSEARAEAVRDWLIDRGVQKDRLEAVGHGEDRPRVDEPEDCHNRKTSDAAEWCEDRIWSHNRRSEFHVTEGLETLPDGEIGSTTTEEGSGGRDTSGPEFNSGPYVYASPAFLRVPVSNREETDSRIVSYRWGVGAGYLWRRRAFVAALGLGFGHVPVTIDGDSDRCTTRECNAAHDFLLDAELRLGGGSRRVIGYGLLGPGLAFGRSRRTEAGSGVTFTTAGFGLDLGAGIWGLVWRGLFIGGEAVFNFAAYGRDVSAFHDRARVGGLDLRLLVGWHFGWR